MKLSLALLFTVAVPVFAQPTVFVQSGINSEIANNHLLDKYWKTGLAAVLGVDLDASSRVRLSPGLMYAYHAFDKSARLFNTIPNRTLGRASGSATHIFRVWVEVKGGVVQAQTLNLGVLTGAGWSTERFGTIQASWLYNGRPEPVQTLGFANRYYFFHTIGFYLDVALSDRFGVNTAVRSVTNFGDRHNLVPLLGVHYSIND